MLKLDCDFFLFLRRKVVADKLTTSSHQQSCFGFRYELTLQAPLMRNFWLLTLFLWLHAKDLQFSQFEYSCFLPNLIFNWFFFSLPQTIKSGSGIMNLGGSLTRQVLNECVYENTFVLPIWLCFYHVWSWHTCGVDMHLELTCICILYSFKDCSW